jgi:preprotein translocase subunit SecG
MEGVQSCSTMAQGGREGITFKILVFLPISFFALSFFLSLFLFSRHKEEGKERTADGAQGYRGAQG